MIALIRNLVRSVAYPYLFYERGDPNWFGDMAAKRSRASELAFSVYYGFNFLFLYLVLKDFGLANNLTLTLWAISIQAILLWATLRWAKSDMPPPNGLEPIDWRKAFKTVVAYAVIYLACWLAIYLARS